MKALYFQGSGQPIPVEAKVAKGGKTADLYIDDELVVSQVPVDPENPGAHSYCKLVADDKPSKLKKTKEGSPDGQQAGEVTSEGDGESGSQDGSEAAK